MPGLEFTESRPLGGAWLLDGLWHRLGIDTLLRRLAGRHPAGPGGGAGAVRAGRQPGAGAVLEAGRHRLGRARRAPPGLTGGDYRVSDDACYRAMDWLISVEAELARGVFDQVAHLLNLEVDLIFFDTTSTYFETEQADEPVWRDAARPPPRRPPTEPDARTAAQTASRDGDAGGRGQAPRARRRRPGSARTASPRTPATTCPRSWSGWP